MLVPIYALIRTLPEISRGHLVSLGPGSNPFMTYYSPTRIVARIFATVKDVSKFRNLQSNLDRLNSVRDPNNQNADWITSKKGNVSIARSLIYTKGHITLLRMRSIRLPTTLPPTTNTSMLQHLNYQGWCYV